MVRFFLLVMAGTVAGKTDQRLGTGSTRWSQATCPYSLGCADVKIQIPIVVFDGMKRMWELSIALSPSERIFTLTAQLTEGYSFREVTMTDTAHDISMRTAIGTHSPWIYRSRTSPLVVTSLCLLWISVMKDRGVLETTRAVLTAILLSTGFYWTTNLRLCP